MPKIMTLCSVLFLLSMLAACNSPTSENDEVPEEEQENRAEILEKKPSPEQIEILDFEGEVSTDESKMSIVKIDIYRKGTTTIFQTLDALQLPYQEENPFFDRPIFEDLNFDGFPDLRMPKSLGTANIYYAYWIYNPTNKKFESNTEMILSLPKVDVAKKEILSFERNSAASYVETTYAYQDGKFLAIRIKNKEYTDEKKYQSVVQERQEDGSMKEVRNELVEEKD